MTPLCQYINIMIIIKRFIVEGNHLNLILYQRFKYVIFLVYSFYTGFRCAAGMFQQRVSAACPGNAGHW